MQWQRSRLPLELFVLRSRRRSVLEEARLTRIDDAPEAAGATA